MRQTEVRVQVFSLMGAVCGAERTIWEGVLPLTLWRTSPGADELDVESVNEQIFRLLNRVDLSDNDRLAQIGYDLPSLSVGDFVTWRGMTFQVQGAGFKQITHSTDTIMANFR